MTNHTSHTDANQDTNQQHDDRAHDDHSGHDDHDGHDGGHHAHHAAMFRRRFWVSLILSIPVLLYSASLQDWLGYSAPEFTGSNWITPLLSIVVFAYGGIPFLRMAVPEIEKRQPGMMTLIGLAITVSFVYSIGVWVVNAGTGFFWELVTLIDVMLLGHWIEMRSIHQASGALQELAKLLPDDAERITEGGDTETVPVNELQNGDLLLVRPGASVPADGEVEEGESSVNEAMITGESKPVDKAPGDEVIGGTINGDGSLRVRVQATGDDTALAGIMRMVDEAQQSKSETQLLADRAAGWLFYVAITVAAITAVAWIIAIGFDVNVIKRVATVLVIACPHALGLAIPLVVAISTSLGAQNGILVRDRVALEQARTVDTVIFDKTGTLTRGEFGVVDSVTADDWDDDRALALAHAVEGDSEHLIARGIRAKAEERDLDAPQVTDFEAIKGRGIRATHDGQTVHVGGPRLLEQLDIMLPDAMQRFTDESGANGHTVVYLINDGQPVAAFALADLIRDESYTAVKRLHERGVDVAMLTGDSDSVAKHVAGELGIDQYFAEVLPEHKEDKVHELNEQGKVIAMVGDGVNDAPALTRADIGIAIGSGTDVAIESADIILVRSNPLDIVNIFDLSTTTHRKMIQNLIWASAYNVVALPLAAGILAPWGVVMSPAVGALFMSLSTVIVAINAQLMRRMDFSDQPEAQPA